MLDVEKPYLYPVVDQETFRVLCFCLNSTIANAVSEGLLNSSPMTVHYPLAGLAMNPVKDYNTDSQKTLALVLKMNATNKLTAGGYVTSDCNVAKVVDQTPTGRVLDFVVADSDSDWQARRRLAQQRNDAIELLERRCDRYLSRTSYFTGDPVFLPYLAQQLALCRPELADYTAVIRDWAEIQEIEPARAYDELKMIWDSAGIAAVKVHALWRKYVRLINQLDNRRDMDACVQVQFESEFRFGKRS